MQTGLSFYRDIQDIQETAFVCLGNPDRADDAFGLKVAEKLKHFGHIKVFSEYDEDTSSILLKILEDDSIKKVVIVDAIDFNAHPGSVLITADISNAVNAVSTHNIPLHTWKQLLEDHDKEFVLLGVQVKTTELFGKMSEEILLKVNDIVGLLDPTTCIRSCKDN